MGTEADKARAAKAAGIAGHWYRADKGYAGSGRDGDPWVLVSWTERFCTCDRPWRH